MRSVLSSPRRRRRILVLGTACLLAGSTAFIGVHWANTADTRPERFTNGPVMVYREPAHVAFRGEMRREAVSAAMVFVKTAVPRRHVGDSWAVVSPHLRQGFTRSTWQHGDIPVQPFPVDFAKWKLDYAYVNKVGLSILVLPQQKSHLTPMVFLMDLVPSRDRHHWLVDSWVPNGGSIGSSSSGYRAAGNIPPTKAELGQRWLTVPFAVMGLLLLVPLSIGIRGWYRNARATRDYRSTIAS